jgi:ATP-dependent DNA helicase RecG
VSHQLQIDRSKIESFIQNLPFTLTGSQLRAVNQILADLGKPQAMNRLLQGDVGAGKTVVAAIAIYAAHLNHLNSILMAPTEALAHQHFDTLSRLFSPFGLTLSLHSHSRTEVYSTSQLVVGTHALLYREMPSNVGLVVIDEQHRFGVEQRAQLLKGERLPNVLSMTATPIPRTIALTLYSELQISVIDELPQGRIPIKTWIVPETKRVSAYHWLQAQIAGQQAQVFIVCPLIEDSATPLLDQVKAAETEYARLAKDIFPQFRLGLLHGRQPVKTKTQVLTAFRQGQLDILVTTPVIEVGLDIPQASIIVIEAAERFGLAQLHQLRGRVGRGTTQSYCLLFTTRNQLSNRLQHLVTNHTGLSLAELDLKLRGPGDLYGHRQSGYFDLKIASWTDSQLITQTHHYASILAATNPQLTGLPLLKHVLLPHLAKTSVPN